MSDSKFCPHCTTTLIRPQDRCHRCGREIDWPPPELEPRVPGHTVILVDQPIAKNQFSLKTLFLVVTGICVWLGVMIAYPIVGVALAILTVFVVWIVSVRRGPNEPASWVAGGWVHVAAVTFGLPVLAVIAVVVIIGASIVGAISWVRRLGHEHGRRPRY